MRVMPGQEHQRIGRQDAAAYPGGGRQRGTEEAGTEATAESARNFAGAFNELSRNLAAANQRV
jgi:hypothetical protein